MWTTLTSVAIRRVDRVEFRKPGPAAATPFSAWATLVGAAARTKVPTALRRLGYSAFAKAVGANLGETELELADYDTFGDFFARKLRPGVSPDRRQRIRRDFAV